MAVAGSTFVLAVVLYLATHVPSSDRSQAIGNLAILGVGIFAVVACARAARRRSAAARGWALMAAGVLVWTVGMAVYAFYGITRDNVYPFPSAADAGFLGYALPAAAALFAFPRPRGRLISRIRAVLDALVITAGIVFVSAATVLQQVREVADLTTLAGWTLMAYPIVDVAMASIVLSLGMRQPPGQRSLWLFLGLGLVTLAVTDSVYVALISAGQTAITGTPLTGGWMLAFLLIGYATLVPPRSTRAAPGRDFSLALQLIPYLPVLGAVVVLVGRPITAEPILLGLAAALVLLVAFRQAMIVYENVSLT